MSGKHDNMDFDRILDRVVDEIANDTMSPEAEQAAIERVWASVRQEADTRADQDPQNHRIRDCNDFQALIPAYAQGALNDAKRMLFEDHVGECLVCRKALKNAKSAGRRAPVASTATSQGWMSRLGWQAAAAAVIFLAVVGLSVNSDVLKIRAGGLVHIESIDGELLKVTDEGAVPVASGEAIQLGRNETLRTTKGSRAMVRLADKSSMEMKERSQVAVLDEAYFWNRSDKDAVLALDRGAVIVEASPQGSGNLFVETDDSKVAVTGTVFSVNKGIRGTRVSVIEGEVHVDNSGRADEDVLWAGQQVTSSPGLEPVDIATEISWSQNFHKHLTLLREMTELSREIDRALAPDRRYSTKLLDLAPDNTVIYIGIPNVSSSLAEAHQMLLDRIDSSEALREWWDENMASGDGEDELQQVIDKITGYGSQLGDEVVVTLQMVGIEVEGPLVLAELSRPAAEVKSFLESELADLHAKNDLGRDPFAVVEGERPDLGGIDADMFLWLHDGLLVGGERETVQQMVADRLTGPTKSAARDGFRGLLRDRYSDGVEWVVGVDLQTILGKTAHRDTDRQGLEELGLLDMTHLIGERKSEGDHTDNRLVLGFAQQRRGIAAWLDEPAPMGSLDFISPDATVAAAFVMQEPAAMVDDLFETLTSMNDDFRSNLEVFEQEHSISIRDDIAATLGGEFALALDGPVLPTPSWKIVIEVYDPAQLQQTLSWAVDQVNQLAAEHDTQGLALHEHQIGGRTFYQLESLDVGISAYYTFVDGYLLAGPSTAVLRQSIQTRDSGATLPVSPKFTSMLSRDDHVHFSGVVYQNLGALIGPLASLSDAAMKLSPEARELADEIAMNTRPSMTLIHGGPDSITFLYTHEGGLMTSLSSFFSFKSLSGMGELLQQTRQN